MAIRSALDRIKSKKADLRHLTAEADYDSRDREGRILMADEARRLQGREEATVQYLGAILRDPRPSGFASCDVAPLLGVVGRAIPELAIRELASSLPQPERVYDLCIANGIAQIGPAGYEPAYEIALESSGLDVTYMITLALVGQTVETGFPEEAGLGKGDEWPAGFPDRKRTLRRLLRHWHDWWIRSSGDLEWDAQTLHLKKRRE